MTGKQIVLDALLRKPTPRVPWVPFAGVHAGLLTGADAITMLQDEEQIVNALLAVKRLYTPDGLPVLFDLQLEAEILGCELKWSADTPPSVRTHPLAEELVIPTKRIAKTDGRMGLALSVMRRVKAEIGEDTALFGLICGPFTLASHLRGNELFMDMYDEPDLVQDLLAYCADTALDIAQYYLEAGCDVIAVVDPLVSQISSDHFDEFLRAPYTRIFDKIRAFASTSAFFVCGDATRNIEGMCKTRPDAIFVDENVDLPAAKHICNAHGVAIGGNLPLTTVMLHGSQQDNMKTTLDLLDAIADKTGFVLAPGCDMPYGVPIENAIDAALTARKPDTARQMLSNYVTASDDTQVDLPDYQNLSKPLIEVFSLDSASCAACTYMMNAAEEAGKRFLNQIDVVEYKFTKKENIRRCRQMGVEKLPSLYINGKLAFSSLIPSPAQLDSAINNALDELKGLST